MPIPCTVCTHEQAEDVNEALLGGESIRDVASRFSLGRSSVDRHRRKCLAPRALRALARHEEQTEERLRGTANGILDRLAFQVVRCQQAATVARRDDDLATERLLMADERAALAQLSKSLELQAKLAGVLGDHPTVHVDARQQKLALILGDMDEETLRALASGAAAELPAPRGELPIAAEAATVVDAA